MAGLAEQHHPRPGEAIEQRAECRIVEVRERLSRGPDQLGDWRRAPRRAEEARLGAPWQGFVRFGPAMLADQRHERHAAEILLLEVGSTGARHLDQPLVTRRSADRYHQPAPDVELILERLRDFRPAGRSQDGVERRGLGPAARAVAGAQLDVVVAQPLQPRRRQPGQLVDALDGIDALGDPADHRGRIARAGADLEHAIARLDLRRCDHQADDVRLRDGLAGFDRQRGVLIGKLAQAFGNEDLTGHPAHGSEHVAVAHASTRQLSIHHPVSVMG